MIEENNYNIRHLNSFQLDVYAEWLVKIQEVDQLGEVFRANKFRNKKKLVLGGGSNVLFTRNYLGLILKMELAGVQVEEDADDSTLVSFGAGENWHSCVLWSIEQGLTGIENLSLIPGTMGAAPMQNIGAYGVELKDVFHSLEAYEIATGKVVRFYREDCRFDYRFSVFKGSAKGKYIITRVFLKLSKKPSFNISYGNLKETLDMMGVNQLSSKAISDAVIQIRQSKLPDPMDIGNAGSFFKNPVIENDFYQALRAAFDGIPGYPTGDNETKIPAGWLIERCGWKGKRIGEVGVHDRQALVLVNHGNGKGKDILKLSKDIQKSVQSTFGVQLETEVNVIS